MAASPIYLGTVKNAAARIQNADGTALITLWTAPALGSKLNALGVSSTDTVARDVALYVSRGGVDYLLATVQVPINAGNANNVPAIDVFAHVNLPWVRQDADGARYLFLENGSVLKAKAVVTVTAATQVAFFMQGGDF